LETGSAGSILLSCPALAGWEKGSRNRSLITVFLLCPAWTVGAVGAVVDRESRLPGEVHACLHCILSSIAWSHPPLDANKNADLSAGFRLRGCCLPHHEITDRVSVKIKPEIS